jgi:hypothetical protein
MNKFEVKVNGESQINLSIEGDTSYNLQEIQTILSLFLKLDSKNREKFIFALKGAILAQESSKGNIVTFDNF